jgi:aminoglycoside phosphotransferase family enzyme/predicted kinase
MSADRFDLLIRGLLDPAAYPHPADCLAHIETHISHVILAGPFAYKLKKPLELGFLDCSTLERRRFCCEEELRLNRRLAPGLYLDLVPVRGSPERPRIELPARCPAQPPGESPGDVLEYAVRMRRFPQEALLDRSPLSPELIDRLAERIAAFHREVPPAAPDSPYGTPQAVLSPMAANFRELRARLQGPEQAERLKRIESWTLGRWEGLIQTLKSRRAEGRVRECHGDLHRGNIALVEGEPLIFDALEFNPWLRWIDTASELAFLVMDLEEAGQAGLAGRLLNRWLELTGDYGALAVLDLYKVYRAMVRAKVLAIRLSQPDLRPAEVQALGQRCVRYLGLAEAYTHRRRPRLLIACGLSGSGKSRLARRLREVLPIVHLRSDVERRRLFGLPLEGRPGPVPETGIYFDQATDWTYQRLFRLAAGILDSGYDAVLDATFLSGERRSACRDLAARHGAGFAILCLNAPIEVLRQRVTRRLKEGCDASEASLSVLERQRSALEPLGQAEAAWTIPIDSTAPPSLEEILARIGEVTGVPVDQPPGQASPAGLDP